MKLTNLEIEELLGALEDTLYLLFVSSIFIIALGFLIGFMLFFFKEREEIYKKPNFIAAKIVSIVIDILRSIPFVILLVALIPFTIFITGSMLGSNAALPALIISAIPFYARIVYMELESIDKGKIEALNAMGASKFKIVFYLTKESLNELISGISLTMITLLGFISSAAVIGAGGLGELAVKKVLNNNLKVAYISIFLMLIIVLLIQVISNFLKSRFFKRKI